MALDRDRLTTLEIPTSRRHLREADVMLYALSVGMGGDPADLPFVYERGLRMVPGMATVLGFDDTWLDAAGVPLSHVFHASQHLTFHAALPVSGDYDVATRIAGAVDKGPGKAALIHQQTELSQGGAAPFATSLATLFVRGGGGFGGSFGIEGPAARSLPDRAPDAVLPIATRPEQALLHRLLGDRNPLHADPEAAAQAGFDQPILHGACTYGIACAAILRQCCGRDPSRLLAMAARFVAPVFPGDLLEMAIWQDGPEVSFRLTAPARGLTILDAGHASLSV